MPAIFPTTEPNISLRVLPKIPATLQGASGIGVNKANGLWTVAPKWEDLMLLTGGLATKELWVRDIVSNTYARMLASDVAAGGGGGSSNPTFSSVTINPPINTLTPALTTNQTAVGSPSGSFFGLNTINVADYTDASGVGAPFNHTTSAFSVLTTTGGNAAKGSHAAITGFINATTDNTVSSANRDYIAGIFNAFAGSPMPATGTNATLFGLSVSVNVASSGTNWNGICGCEVDVGTSASVAYHTGWTVVNFSTVAPTIRSVGYQLSGVGGSQGWQYGFALTNIHGGNALISTGKVMALLEAQTVDTIFDFSLATVTTNVFNFPNLTLNGSVSAASMTLFGSSSAQYLLKAGGVPAAAFYADTTRVLLGSTANLPVSVLQSNVERAKFFATNGILRIGNTDPVNQSQFQLSVMSSLGSNCALFAGSQAAGNMNSTFQNEAAANVANTVSLAFALNTDVQIRNGILIKGGFTTITDASRVSQLEFQNCNGGAIATRVIIGAALTPGTAGGTALGTVALPWSGLNLFAGGQINFDNDVTITHSANVLTFAGAATGYRFNDGAGSTFLVVGGTAALGSAPVTIYAGSTPACFAATGSASTTGLDYYNNPSFFFQNSTATNNNMAAIDFRTANGNSAGAIVCRFIDHAAGVAKGQIEFYTANAAGAGARRQRITEKGSFVAQDGVLATNATDGFLYITTCAGTPTGTPTAQTGCVAMVYDTSGNFLYVYNGAWKKVALT